MAAVSAAPRALDAIDTAEFEALRARFGPIQGYLHDEEGYALFRLARANAGPGRIVEIGSFMGKSTAWLACGNREAGRDERVAAVDHFLGSPEHQPGGTHPVAAIARHGSTFPCFEANLRAVDLLDRVEPIRLPSLRAAEQWRDPIRLLLIDGEHSYVATRDDLAAWIKFLAPGACVAFHDIGAWPGATRFYNDLLASRCGFTECMAVRTLRVVRLDV